MVKMVSSGQSARQSLKCSDSCMKTGRDDTGISVNNDDIVVIFLITLLCYWFGFIFKLVKHRKKKSIFQGEGAIAIGTD